MKTDEDNSILDRNTDSILDVVAFWIYFPFQHSQLSTAHVLYDSIERTHAIWDDTNLFHGLPTSGKSSNRLLWKPGSQKTP